MSAQHLASIFGTEKDKVNCSFYFKIGACRHGNKCLRQHMKPTVSPTILLPNLYQSPVWTAPAGTFTDAQEKEHLENFYLEMFEELAKFGDIDQIYLCENTCDHLIGNVYVKYYDEAAATKGEQPRFVFSPSLTLCSVRGSGGTVLCRATHCARVFSGDGLSGGVVSAARHQGVHAGRVLQLYAFGAYNARVEGRVSNRVQRDWTRGGSCFAGSQFASGRRRPLVVVVVAPQEVAVAVARSAETVAVA